jgi:tetratricopeptide (TPR) repeat protein
LAQAAWIARKVGDLEFELNVHDTPRSYEAGAWTNMTNGHWEDSLVDAELWLCDEPFSKRPTRLGSWIALSTTADYVKAEQMARHGLKTHHDDFILLNNLAVSLAYQGKPNDALEYMKKMPQKTSEDLSNATYLATSGLLKFRLGATDEGRKFYRMAVDDAKSKKGTGAVVSALLHFAREEYRLGGRSKGDELVKEALLDFDKLSAIERIMANRMLELVTPA